MPEQPCIQPCSRGSDRKQALEPRSMGLDLLDRRGHLIVQFLNDKN
jgi:hypothetical protein